MQDPKSIGRKGLKILEDAVLHLDCRAGLVDEAISGLCSEIEDEVVEWNAKLLNLISGRGAAGKICPAIRRVGFSGWNGLDFPYLFGISPMDSEDSGCIAVSSAQLTEFERFIQRYNTHMRARFQGRIESLRSAQDREYESLLESALMEKISSAAKSDKALLFVKYPDEGIFRADWDLYSAELSSVCRTGIVKEDFFARRRMRKDAESLRCDAYIVKSFSKRLSGKVLLTYAAGTIQAGYEVSNPEVAASRSTMKAWSGQGVRKAALWTAEDLVRKFSGRDVIREMYLNNCPGCGNSGLCFPYNTGREESEGKEKMASEGIICREKTGLPN
jgi:hypothetical protein